MKNKEVVIDGVVYVQIANFDNYIVSNCGSIRSIDRKIEYSDGRTNTHYGKELRPFMNKHGYLVVTLCNESGHHKKQVHRLVAEGFLANATKLNEVNHKNLNKTDNRKENLEWISGENNINHADRNGVLRHFGKLNGNYKVGLHLE
jgi:hypothetical protein